jgi:hypothetical protein
MKKLSDGTKAKVGLIVVVIDGNITDGNDSGTVTKIISFNSIFTSTVECTAWNPPGPCTMTEQLSNLRVATPKEAAAYKE